MKKLRVTLYAVLTLLLCTVISLNIFAEIQEIRNRTEGSVDLQIGTTSYGGQYAPRHVFAVWVCDENDNFVRTLVKRAASYTISLVKWNQMSGGNYQNAIITGASLNSHSTHNLTWDCTDYQGNSLEDGTYKIYAEYTESNSHSSNIPNGPWIVMEFEKAGNEISMNPANENGFINLELTYTPEETPIPSIEITSPTNNSTIESLPLDVVFSLENFAIDSGAGSIGVFVNDTEIANHMSSSNIIIESLVEGNNEIVLKLYDASGNLFDPSIEATVNVNYQPVSNNEIIVPQVNEKITNCYPNPFSQSNSRSSINIQFNLAKDSHIKFDIFNIKGEKIDSIDKGFMNKGENNISLNLSDKLSTGIYFTKLIVNGNEKDSQKITVIK